MQTRAMNVTEYCRRRPAASMRVISLFAMIAMISNTATMRSVSAQDGPIITGLERQPFVAATRRLVEAIDFAGAPLSEEVITKLQSAMVSTDDRAAIRDIQEILDPLCLAMININAESRVKVAEGLVKKELMQQGWRAFLIKVHNEAGINPVLQVESPNALPVYQQGKGSR